MRGVGNIEELVSKTSYIHSDMLLICKVDFILQLKMLLCLFCWLISFDIFCNMYKVIKSGNEVNRRGFGTIYDSFCLFVFVFLCVYKSNNSTRKQF